MDPLRYGETARGTYRVLRARGKWSTELDARDNFQIVAVRSGQCWFECPQILDRPLLVSEGGIVCTSGVATLTCRSALDTSVNPGTPPLSPELGVRLLRGVFPLCTNPSLHAFPRLFHVPATEIETTGCLDVLFDLIERESEIAPDTTEHDDVLRRAGEILVIMLARHVGRHTPGDRILHRDAIDPKVLRAIKLIETEAARNWTVESLAAEVGMGRSAFAVKFRQIVGDTPVNCLFKTRMRFASELICAQGSSIAVVAEAIGYQSESAFSKAFARHFGMTPGQYRTEATATRLARRLPTERRVRRRYWGQATGHRNVPAEAFAV
jgi:AraC-like DNA-binding protein